MRGILDPTWPRRPYEFDGDCMAVEVVCKGLFGLDLTDWRIEIIINKDEKVAAYPQQQEVKAEAR